MQEPEQDVFFLAWLSFKSLRFLILRTVGQRSKFNWHIKEGILLKCHNLSAN